MGNQLCLYEEAPDIQGHGAESAMHGAAVASITVGKTVGVAPGADLYYIATQACSTGTAASVDFACLAQSVRRILEINMQLPAGRKVRVVSMSTGWGPPSKGYAEVSAAAQEAKAAGMLVVSSSIRETHGFRFNALVRQPLSDPEVFESYEPGMWWAESPPFLENKQMRDASQDLVVSVALRRPA